MSAVEQNQVVQNTATVVNAVTSTTAAATAPVNQPTPALGLGSITEGTDFYGVIRFNQTTPGCSLTLANLLALNWDVDFFSLFAVICVEMISFEVTPMSAGSGGAIAITRAGARVGNLMELNAKTSKAIIVGTFNDLRNVAVQVQIPQGCVGQVMPVATNGQPWEIHYQPVNAQNNLFVGAIRFRFRGEGPLIAEATLPGTN